MSYSSRHHHPSKRSNTATISAGDPADNASEYGVPADSVSANADVALNVVDAGDASTADTRTSLTDTDKPAMTFAQLGVPEQLVKALARDDKTTAFPIQEATIPDSLRGRDILGRGATGSGKTLAYAIPLISRIRPQSAPNRPHGLVLAPTRELANQINDVLLPLARSCGMHTTTIYGGVRQSRQTNDLRRGVDIVVACPGRLKDLINQGRVSLDDVEVTVLDEADEMADMGFLPDVSELLEMTPSDGQRLLFSATLDHGVDTVVRRFLNDPKIHEIDSATAQVSTMTQHVFQVTSAEKPQIVEALASGTGKRILFTKTKMQAEELATRLIDHGIPSAQLHGNLSQAQRDRNLKAFSSDEVHVMVATDVAARGMDISGVELVAQIDPPQDPKSFLHRSGRTARAGHSGDVVTLVLPKQKRRTLQMLHRAGINGHAVRVDEQSDQLQDLIGEQAPTVDGWSLDEFTKRQRKHQHDDRRDRNGSDRRGRNNRRDRGDGRDRDHERGYEHGRGHGYDSRRVDRHDTQRDAWQERGDARGRVNDREDDWSKPFDGRSDRKRAEDSRGRSNRRFHDDSHGAPQRDGRRHDSTWHGNHTHAYRGHTNAEASHGMTRNHASRERH